MNYLLLRHLFRMSPAMGYLKALCLIPSVRFAIRMCYPKMTYSVCLIYSRAFHNSKNRIHWLKSTPRSVAYPVSLPSQMDSPTSARESFTSPSQRHEAEVCAGSGSLRLSGGGQGQGKPEGGALARGALDADLPLMTLNDVSTNVQPQSQSDPGAALDLDPLDPVEAFPDACLFFRRQPWPLIAHPDPRLVARHVEPHHHGLLSGRVFECVGQIVGHDL